MVLYKTKGALTPSLICYFKPSSFTLEQLADGGKCVFTLSCSKKINGSSKIPKEWTLYRFTAVTQNDLQEWKTQFGFMVHLHPAYSTSSINEEEKEDDEFSLGSSSDESPDMSYIDSTDVLSTFENNNIQETKKDDDDGTDDDTDDDLKTECTICMNAPRDALCVPCGHLCACYDCLIALTTKLCPVCRSPLNQVVRIYSA